MPRTKSSPTSNKTRKVPSLLTLYKHAVFPLLLDAGFEGTVARSRLMRGRGQFWFHARQRGDKLAVDAYGTDGAKDYTLMMKEVGAPEPKREAEIKKLAKAVERVLARIEKLAVASEVEVTGSPDAALKVLLESVAKRLRGTPVGEVKLVGKEARVHLRGRTKTVVADRLALMTLVRELWNPQLGEHGEPARGVLQCGEFEQYVAQVAKNSKHGAQALYVHVEGPYDLPRPKGDVLHRLFPRPLTATKELVSAASAGALVKRALPHAKKGALVDRLAAIWVVDFTLCYAMTHRDADALLEEAGRLAHSLSNSETPLLHEAGWLLAEEVGRQVEARGGS